MRLILILFFCISALLSIQTCNADTSRTIFYVVTNTNRTAVSFFNSLKQTVKATNTTFKLATLDSVEFTQQGNVLYIAVGNRSFRYLIEKNISAPILAIFISRLSFQRILDTRGKKLKNSKISAVFSDPAPIHQLYLTKYLFPNAPKSTVIISNRTEFLQQELKDASTKTGVPLDIILHTKNHKIGKTLHEIGATGVILALPDSSIYNSDTIPRIILSAYRHNQSIVGFSRQFVEAGALATVYTDTGHIQNEVVDILEKYIARGILPSPTYPRLFDVEINERVSDSYNLILPSESSLKKNIKYSLEVCCEK